MTRASRPTFSELRLLYVEDEVLIALDTQDQLAELGFTAIAYTAQPAQALEHARTGEFDLALLDVNLGHGETSLPIAQALRRRGIPLIFLTGYNSVELLDDFEWARIVEKPISQERLTTAICDTLADAEAENEAAKATLRR